MKKLNFEQMECVMGGNCAKEYAVAYGGAIATVASIECPPVAIFSGLLAAVAYYDYYKCLGIFG